MGQGMMQPPMGQGMMQPPMGMMQAQTGQGMMQPPVQQKSAFANPAGACVNPENVSPRRPPPLSTASGQVGCIHSQDRKQLPYLAWLPAEHPSSSPDLSAELRRRSAACSTACCVLTACAYCAAVYRDRNRHDQRSHPA